MKQKLLFLIPVLPLLVPNTKDPYYDRDLFVEIIKGVGLALFVGFITLILLPFTLIETLKKCIKH